MASMQAKWSLNNGQASVYGLDSYVPAMNGITSNNTGENRFILALEASVFKQGIRIESSKEWILTREVSVLTKAEEKTSLETLMMSMWTSPPGMKIICKLIFYFLSLERGSGRARNTRGV